MERSRHDKWHQLENVTTNASAPSDYITKESNEIKAASLCTSAPFWKLSALHLICRRLFMSWSPACGPRG